MRPWLAMYGVSIAFSVLGVYAMFYDHLAFTFHNTTPEFIVGYIVILALYLYCFMALHSLLVNKRIKSQSELVINELSAGCLMSTTNDVPEKTKPEAKDFNYVKLV